jgi:hypothetical protein
MNRRCRRHRLVSYAYGELEPGQIGAMEGQASADPALARALAAERALQQLIPVGAGPSVPEACVTQTRAALAVLLRQASRRSRPHRWPAWFEPWRRGWALALSGGVAAGVVIGWIAGWSAWRGAATPGEWSGSVVGLRLAGEPTGARVSLTVDLLAQHRIEGDVDDEAIQRLLAQSLAVDLLPSTRLVAAGLLGRAPYTKASQAALATALTGDPNPGVRLQAAAALAPRSGDAAVRSALLRALAEDVNPGVRLAAVEALAAPLDADARCVLERVQAVETNPYIRQQAGRLLAGPTAASDL